MRAVAVCYSVHIYRQTTAIQMRCGASSPTLQYKLPEDRGTWGAPQMREKMSERAWIFNQTLLMYLAFSTWSQAENWNAKSSDVFAPLKRQWRISFPTQMCHGKSLHVLGFCVSRSLLSSPTGRTSSPIILNRVLQSGWRNAFLIILPPNYLSRAHITKSSHVCYNSLNLYSVCCWFLCGSITGVSVSNLFLPWARLKMLNENITSHTGREWQGTVWESLTHTVFFIHNYVRFRIHLLKVHVQITK